MTYYWEHETTFVNRHMIAELSIVEVFHLSTKHLLLVIVRERGYWSR